MKYVPPILLCLCIAGTGAWHAPALAEDAQTSQAQVPAFYNWLEKYQNPSAPTAVQPEKSVENRQDAAAVKNPSSLSESSSFLVSDPGGAIDPAETAGPGEGLGCFYHRSYYSHLPLFKNGMSYTLPGSLSVAEPYQKPSSSVFASPVDPPH